MEILNDKLKNNKLLYINVVLMQDTYSMELSGLTGDCEYEVRIRAMNSQGWSPLSSSFIFRTSGTPCSTPLILIS